MDEEIRDLMLGFNKMRTFRTIKWQKAGKPSTANISNKSTKISHFKRNKLWKLHTKTEQKSINHPFNGL